MATSTISKLCRVEGCTKPRKRKQAMCCMHVARQARHGDPNFAFRQHGEGRTKEERFWSKVALTADPNRCWEWQGSCSIGGYGHLKYQGRDYRAHRLAWRLTYGADADGCLLHSCDNPPCVNPNHLREGTRQENVQDMVDKGRQADGERCGKAKLTQAQVVNIREMLARGVGQGAIARRFGISQSTVSQINRNQTWRSEL